MKLKKIPYGLSDFKRIKTENWYYIDKTKYIEEIENESSFLFFLRPRRFGKSLMLNMLLAYYDIYYKSQFNDIFKDTYILDNPTEEKNKYYCMKFDFSAVDITDREAFYKEFFTMLKVGTSDNDSAIRKMFITGVSPLALFDVTSGNNIGSNVSSSYRLNAMVGVTKDELITMCDYYGLNDKKEDIITRCDEWYDGYRFNEDIPYTIYNSDMILYYLKSLIQDSKERKELIDVNVRTDYSKLKYLVYTNKKLNGNFDLLNQLI